MATIIPTKKIPQLTAYGVPLAGSEMLEISVTGTSRRITARDFVLPIDSVLTLTGMGGTLPGSRQLTEGVGILFVDGGAGSTLQINATGAVAGPANPTALVGLAAVNGAAITYMRSDAAPALDVSISPTWLGTHTFSQPVTVSQGSPAYRLNESDAAVDNRLWDQIAIGEQLFLRAVNDAGAVATPWVTVDRTGTVIDIVNLQATTVQANGANVRDASVLFNTGTVPAARLPSSFSGLANPTALVGLAAVNGVATTAMRSDAAPALDQGITPTWTGAHTFNNTILSSSTDPIWILRESDAAVDNKVWTIHANGEQLHFTVETDSFGGHTHWAVVDRTGTTIDSVEVLVGTNNFLVGSSISSTVGQFRSTKVWALNNLINYGLVVSSTAPAVALQETDAAANNGIWDIAAISEQLLFRLVGDGVLSTVDWLRVDRTTTTVDTITFPNGSVTIAGELLLTNSNTVGGSYAVELRSTEPAILLFESDAAANNGQWDIGASGETLRFRAINDAYAAATNWMVVDRTGITIDLVTISAPVTVTGIGMFTRPAVGGTINDLSVALSSSAPILGFNETIASADNRLWEVSAQGESFFIRAYTDNGASLGTAIQIDRTGVTIDQLLFAATTLRFNTTTATTVGAAGGASALPATPTGYLTVNVNGTAQKIPYYNT